MRYRSNNNKKSPEQALNTVKKKNETSKFDEFDSAIVVQNEWELVQNRNTSYNNNKQQANQLTDKDNLVIYAYDIKLFLLSYE